METGLVGYEGMVGVSLALGVNVSSARAVVQVAVLGVRRVSVTLACAALRSRNLASHERGKIRILNRRGLEEASCFCYRKIETLHAT